MKASNARVQRLREMMTLEERRERLQADLDSLLAKMSALKTQLFEDAGRAVHSIADRIGGRAKTRVGPRRARRGVLKERILSALHAAGSAGVRVKDLAIALGTNPVNIHSWFHSTGKRNPDIKKVRGGHYRLAGRAAAVKAAPRSRPGTRKVRKSTAPASRHGELAARILEQLRAAGAKGVNISTIADNLGAKYKNISIWFATTGKKNAKIRKIAPATYRLAT